MDDRLRDVIASVFDVDPASISESDSPETIAGWDSVNHIHLILSVEAEFGVQFDPNELAGLMSVDAIQQRIQGSATDA